MPIIRKDVFISYRRTNFPWALSIYQYLTQHGYSVFFDYKSIDSGIFERTIIENIIGRDHFIVILSSSSVENKERQVDWLKKEIEIALRHQRNIIPIMLEGFEFSNPDAVEFITGPIASLKDYQGLRIYADYYEEAFDRLCSKRYLDKTLDMVHHSVSEIVEQEVIKLQDGLARERKVEIRELTAQEWFERGFRAKEPKEQIRCYTQTITLDPKFMFAYNNRGLTYSKQGEYEKAIQDYDQAIKLNPELVEAYSNRGITNSNQGEYEKAIQDYDQAIKLNPELVEAYSNRGITYSKQGECEKAIQDYDQAIKLNPEYANAYYNKACCYGLMGKILDAVIWLRKTLELEKEYYCNLTKDDSDFDQIRSEEAFQELMKEYCNG